MIHVVVVRFWKRAGYVPLYIRQTTSELTGEHACVMVRGLNSSVDSELEWMGEFAQGLLNIDCHHFPSCSVTDVVIYQTSENDSFRYCRSSSGNLGA